MIALASSLLGLSDGCDFLAPYSSSWNQYQAGHHSHMTHSPQPLLELTSISEGKGLPDPHDELRSAKILFEPSATHHTRYLF